MSLLLRQQISPLCGWHELTIVSPAEGFAKPHWQTSPSVSQKICEQ